MKQATLDILDAALRRGYARYSAAAPVDRIKFYRREFLCDPTTWTPLYTLISQHTFGWQEFRFRDAVANNDLETRIPSAAPGMYIFYVRPENLVYHFPQLALYVGISNATGSGRALRERLKDYMNFERVLKRQNVHQMLQLYYDHIWVAFSHLSLPAAQMRDLETHIHDFLGPPFGRSAYSLEIRAAQNAWDR
jgi:hypothetical protein